MPNWSVLRTGYHLCENGDWSVGKRFFIYVMVRQQSTRAPLIRESSTGNGYDWTVSEPIPEFMPWKAPSAKQRQPRPCIAHG